MFEDGYRKIFKIGYNILWQAEYEKGWGVSKSMKWVQKCFPEDTLGPGEIVIGGKGCGP